MFYGLDGTSVGTFLGRSVQPSDHCHLHSKCFTVWMVPVWEHFLEKVCSLLTIAICTANVLWFGWYQCGNISWQRCAAFRQLPFPQQMFYGLGGTSVGTFLGRGVQPFDHCHLQRKCFMVWMVLVWEHFLAEVCSLLIIVICTAIHSCMSASLLNGCTYLL
jgi:hypothetical protein